MDTLNLFSFLKILWKGRWFVGLCVLSVTLLAILYSLTLPNIYQAQATIMPLASSSSANTNVSGLFSLLSGSGGAGSDTKSFLLYLQSKKLRAQVVEALQLMPVFFSGSDQKTWDDPERRNQAVNTLGGMVSVGSDRIFASTVLISVKNRDPQLATKIARQYLAELQNFISNNSLTQSKRYRLFLEEQLSRNKEELLHLGVALADFYGRNPVSESRGIVNVPIAIKTGMGMRNFKNYDEFKRHFNVLQKSNPPENISQEIQYVQGVPHQAYLRYLQTQQQVLEANYMGLSQSYQMAKLEEAKQEPSFQVLEEPIVPKNKIAPSRRRIATGSFAVSFFLSILIVFYRALRPFGFSIQNLNREEAPSQQMIEKYGIRV